MTRVRLVLVAALLFYCTIRVQAGEAPPKPEDTTAEPSKQDCSIKPAAPARPLDATSRSGKVNLTGYTGAERALDEDDCFKFICDGTASPHKKIIWYRLLDPGNNSTGLPIREYWSEGLYYEIKATSTGDEISSALIIDKFNSRFEGVYYCILTNGETSIRSPMTKVYLNPYTAGYGGHTDQVQTLDDPLYIQNITATKINSTSVVITWDRLQRNANAKFCKIWREGTKRSESYTWTLQILKWANWTSLYSDRNNYDQIKMLDYYEANERTYNMSLVKANCDNRSYLLIDLSPTAYYKFQIMVEKHKKSDNTVKVLTRNGSYIHYFGKQSAPMVVYPEPHQQIHRPFDANICQATGNPPPRIQLVQPVESNNNMYKCIADNIIIDNFGGETPRYHMLDFYWDTTSVDPSPDPSPPQPTCVSIQSHDSVCSQYMLRGSKVYVPSGENVTVLEERAAAVISGLRNNAGSCYNKMVKFICYSYLAPCYLDTPIPRKVCPQSCKNLRNKCNSQTFEQIQKQLPEWSAARNCSYLKKSVAGSPQECIHLSAPPVNENHTDGSCLVGKGAAYTGDISDPECIPWDDEKQTFYDISIFTELKSAGSSCRNPGGSGNRPWCYVNLTSTISSSRWKYCNSIPQCPSCGRVPDVCSEVYSENSTVHVRSNSYPVNNMLRDCFPNNQGRCYKVWNTLVCHLAYPKCVEATKIDQLHSSMPLCKSYCNAIKNATHTCHLPSQCDQSLFIHQIEDMDCSGLPEENCLSATLDIESPDAPITDTGDSNQKSSHQLAISIYVAAAVCLFSVFTIVAIIIGYCCCLYSNEDSQSKFMKPIENPLDHPVFSKMKMHCIDNPNYVMKTPSEKDNAFKSLRPISKSKIHYIRDLGSGNFGLVYQGKVDGIIDGEEFTMAAIKTLREGTSAEGMKNFLHEAKLACQFDHENIIKLYGICMSESFYCLVFEYMDLGDLNEFLRNSASSTQRRIMNPLDSSSRSRTESSLSNNPPRLNSQQLVSICHQIALGMEYFASLNHVHRDLATRNCLVGTGLVVKIGDFGMSQTLYHSDYYKQKGEQALPVRWMAPEAFIYGRFSTEGDVWSFGVVMWEVFSFAMQPYYGKMNDQVMNEVRRGHTLSRPDDCHESVFEIMRSCWQMEPHRRPTFTELVEELNNWKPTRCSTSTALESQGSTKGDIEDSLSLSSIQDKDCLEISVFDEYNMSGTEEDLAN